MASSSSSSPLHASILENNSKLQTNHNQENPSDLSSPFCPAYGAGSPSTEAARPPPRSARTLSNTRQKRRLQLRNAGFRGPTLPGRRVTPSNTSSTFTATTWSTSDAENVSPLGRMKKYEDHDSREKESNWSTTRRNDSGVEVLQDIVNSSAVRHARPRVTSAKFWTNANADAGQTSIAYDNDNNTSSPPLASPPNQPRSGRWQAKMHGHARRLIREQRRQDSKDEHIEYLERMLDETVKENGSAASDALRQQSDRMRRLNAENQGLHKDLKDWEDRYQLRISEVIDEHRQTEDQLRGEIEQLQAEVAELQRPIEDMHAVHEDRLVSEKLAKLDDHFQTMAIAFEDAKERNISLQETNDRLNNLLAQSRSPAKFGPPTATPGQSRRGRPMSLNVRVPTASELAMSPDRFSATSPSFSCMMQSPRGPTSPLSQTFSPEVMSPVDNANESDASFGSTSIRPPDTISRRTRRMRQFEGSTGPRLLLLPETSLSTKRTLRSAPPFESHDGERSFKFPPVEVADGSPHGHRRRSSPRSSIIAPSPPPSGLNPVTTNTELDTDTSLKMYSPTSSSFEGVNERLFSASTIDSTIGNSFGRNLMDELTAARNFSTSTDNEHISSDPAHTDHASTDDTINTVLRASPHSSPFDSEVEELPEEDTNNEGVTTNATIPAVDTGPVTVRPDSTLYAERRNESLVIHHIMHNRASNASLMSASQASLSTVGMASHSSRSTLDSLRTVLSNLFRSPVELVKHLVQAAQARMSIPRPFLSIQWWLVGVLFGPMARKGMLGRKSASPGSDCCSLLENDSEDEDVNALSYGTTYQTPRSSPFSVAVGTHSMVAGTGKKRASSLNVRNAAGVGAGKAAKHCPHQPRRWKHSPWLWLKFSMCLAVAVGVAFKDGPSSLLKEAVCQACKSKKGNWRKTNRDEPFTPRS